MNCFNYVLEFFIFLTAMINLLLANIHVVFVLINLTSL